MITWSHQSLIANFRVIGNGITANLKSVKCSSDSSPDRVWLQSTRCWKNLPKFIKERLKKVENIWMLIEQFSNERRACPEACYYHNRLPWFVQKPLSRKWTWFLRNVFHVVCMLSIYTRAHDFWSKKIRQYLIRVIVASVANLVQSSIQS